MITPSEITARTHLVHDAALVVISIILAWVIGATGILPALLLKTNAYQIVGMLIAGFFFTSIFTTAPAIVALGQLAKVDSLWLTAFVGAIGAVLGDVLLFRFFREQVSKDVQYLAEVAHPQRLIHIFHLKLFRWVIPFIGALIIASPLPDELGLALMGLSKMKVANVVPLTFIFNIIGIVGIGLVARAIR